ncbi:outer membrane efflux protein [Rhodopirellula maiorica SM1]|uniref:Outer membrane efflux protein n=2 Tax=Novipirellula TaxID=2795426 RepID=M5RS44_9BACT|nr:outer membrane efflux protein [Rhodopirellula maiorica SM1]
MLMLVIIVSGCHWTDRWAKRRDQTSMHYVLSSNQALDSQTVQSTPLPEPPVQLASANTTTKDVAPEMSATASESPSAEISLGTTPQNGLSPKNETSPGETSQGDQESPSAIAADRELSLHEAIETSLQQSRIARVADAGQVTASGTTFYDVEASEARMQAALAAFDSQFESQFYSNEFNNPPNAFFGPGLTEPLQRDERALTASLTKPLRNGGSVQAAYNPNPGYLFLPDSTSSGFNPTYASELALSLRQPLLRGAGTQVNMAPIQIARIEMEQSAWDFKGSLMESVRSVTEAFWDLYQAQVAVEEYRKVIPILEEIVRIQRESLAAKLVIQADVAKARAQLHEYQQEYIRLQSERVSRELRLRNLLKLSPGAGGTLVAITEPTDQKIQVDPQGAYFQAIDNRPDVVQRRLEIGLRRLELLVRNNQRKPNLDFTALYRMNGLGENLGDAIEQMATADFSDLQLGITMSMPVGLRQAKALAQEARVNLVRDSELLQQQIFSVSHEISESAQRIEYAYQEYEQAKLQLEAADEWARGAKLRYQNPAPDSGDNNWMLPYLDDYYRAIRSRTDAAIAVAGTLTNYNFEIVQFEEIKGTLLDFFAIYYLGDPCRQSIALPKDAEPVIMSPLHRDLWTNDEFESFVETATQH